MNANAAAPYQLLAPLAPEQRAALKADIAARGIMVPVEIDDEGRILDGHHRAAIAAELGIDYPTIVRRFATEAEKREHVLKLNLARRHLDAVQWGQAFKVLLAERGVERGQGSSAKKRHRQSATIADVAAEVGVSERTARHRVAQAEAYAALSPSLREAVDTGEVTLEEVRGIAGYPPELHPLELADLRLDKAVVAYITGLRDWVVWAEEQERRGHALPEPMRAFLRRQQRRRLRNPQAFEAVVAAAQQRCRHLTDFRRGPATHPAEVAR